MASKAAPLKPTPPSTPAAAISIKQAQSTRTPSSSLLSQSMRNSFKHEVFDNSFGSPIIHTASGQGFLWNREVFLRDEYVFSGQQRIADERIVAHEIVLDEDDMMF